MPTLEERVAALELAVAELTAAVRETVTPLKELVETLRPIPSHLVTLTDNQRELTGTVAELTDTVRTVVQAQIRIEQGLQTLVARLAGLQIRTEERLSGLEEAVTHLTEAQARTERRVDNLDARINDLVGMELRHRYRDLAHAYFQRILRNIRPVDPVTVQQALDGAVQQGRITEEEKYDVLLADVLALGRRDGDEVYLIAEVSETVEPHDVERAARRAQLLERATGVPTLAAVAGRKIGTEAEVLCRTHGVWRVLHGWAEPPEG